MHNAGRFAAAAPADTLFDTPLKQLAAITAATSVLAQLLSRLGNGASIEGASIHIVIGQSLWNAAQVGTLVILLALWRLAPGWRSGLLAGATVACLPVAIYAISPGAFAFTELSLLTCWLAGTVTVSNFRIRILDAPVRGTPMLFKFETLAFGCSLLCSMYNYNYSGDYWPHWAGIYRSVGATIGLTMVPAELTRGLFTLGLADVHVPSFVPLERDAATIGGSAGVLAYTLIWTMLPFLYVLYFAVCAKLAEKSPGTRIQQALCLFCIFHFLFLTDFVDYEFGRGVINPVAEWAHWSERLAWRIAILLPIYQKVTSGHWRRGNGVMGIVMDYALAAFAVIFAVNQLLIFDIPRFLQFASGQEVTARRLFGISYKAQIGYAGALVLMTLVYGFMSIAMRCKRVQFNRHPVPRLLDLA